MLPTNPPQLTDEQFEQQVFAVIAREFGLGGLARFIMTYRSGHGDYTTDRHRLLDGLTIKDITAKLQ